MAGEGTYDLMPQINVWNSAEEFAFPNNIFKSTIFK